MQIVRVGILRLRGRVRFALSPAPLRMTSSQVYRFMIGVEGQRGWPFTRLLDQSFKRCIAWLETYAATVCPSALPRTQDVRK
jgi:hypothetical protein